MVNIHKCCYKFLKKQYKTLLAYEDGVLKDTDVEDIHQMRVVIRRIRSAIKSFDIFIDQEFKLLVKQDLKTLARRLGNVRDFDVSILYFSDYLLKDPDNEGIKYLIKSFSKNRKLFYKELRTFLVSNEYKRIKKNLKLLISNMHEKSLKKPKPESYSMYYKGFEKIINEVYFYKKIENLSKNDEQLHMLRIAIKSLRYNMEFLNLKKVDAKKAVKYFKGMQEKLGIINDCDFINDKLYHILSEGNIERKYLTGIKTLVKYNEDLKEQSKSQIAFPWQKLDIDVLKNIYKPCAKIQA